MSHQRNLFGVWFSEFVKWLRPKDPSVPPPAAALDRFPAAQAAYLEYLNTPLVWTKIDRAEIEKQFSALFEALDAADRPVRWFDSFAPGYAYVRDKCVDDIMRWAGGVIGKDEGLDAGAPGKSDSDEDEGSRWGRAIEAAEQSAGRDLPRRVRDRWAPVKYVAEQAREAALYASWGAAATPGGNPDWSRARNGALHLAKKIANEAFETAWTWARKSVVFEHGVGEGGGADGAAGRCAYAAVRRAFAAGLWTFWVRDECVIAVPAPNLYTDDQGRLHRMEGAAVEWPGETHWFVNGESAQAAAMELPEGAHDVHRAGADAAHDEPAAKESR